MVVEHGVRIDVVSPSHSEPALRIALKCARGACVRADEDALVVDNNLGRVLAIDLRTGTLVRDLRMRE